MMYFRDLFLTSVCAWEADRVWSSIAAPSNLDLGTAHLQTHVQ